MNLKESILDIGNMITIKIIRCPVQKWDLEGTGLKIM